MKRRLFLALPLHKRFYKILSLYRDHHGRIPYLRWVPVHNLHLTVLFLGHVEEYKIPDLAAVVATALQGKEIFDLTFDGITYAPRHRPADMVWAQFRPHPEFEKLVEEIKQKTSNLITVPNSSHRELIPHCTLARFRPNVPKRPLLRLKRTGLEGDRMPVDRVVLFESRLREAGALYRPLTSFEVVSV